MRDVARRVLVVFVAVVALAAITAQSRDAAAEPDWGVLFGGVALATGGTTAVVLDGISIAYLTRDPGPEMGRLVVGISSVPVALFLMEFGVVFIGEGGGGTAISAANVALGATTLGLGLATMASYRSPEAAVAVVPSLLRADDGDTVPSLSLVGVF